MLKIGFKLYLEKEFHSPIIVTFKMPKNSLFNFNYFYNNLSKYGFIIYPGSITNQKTLRIGCIGNINFKDINLLLNAIRKTLLKMKINYL